ncbi:MAG: type VI secretion system spike protein VgrG1b [Methylomicrobium sp.]
MAQNRVVTVISPLSSDELLFRKMSGHEAMGRLFEFEIELLRPDIHGSVDIARVLGEDMSVKVTGDDGTVRFFSGAVAEFKHIGVKERHYCYRAVLRPWLWFLTLTNDCKIFQDKNIPDIIREVFADYSFADVEYQLSETYETLEYCVQYRESDFNFVSRLMEHAGIFYYFKHREGKHTLVLTDSGNAYHTVSGYDSIPYFPPENTERRERDHIYQWLAEHRVSTGKYELNDFDFEAPSDDLTAKSQVSRPYSQSDFEVYDYPGKYKQANIGSVLTGKRIEEIHSKYSTIQAAGDALALQPGLEFQLKDFYFREENAKHYIVAADYQVSGEDYETSGGAPGHQFICCFVAVNSKQAYRSERLTPKPVIAGTQTAIVVGKSGEEIWTDKYGRVKVQFHWDRIGKNDEKSSCWIRVSFPMAGKQWGWISLPRIGQEVVVSFLEGDPDRPLITGRVYNAEQMPPYALPDNQTQSGIKTRSSKDGSADNFNELRFEDKKGQEEIYLHAEKDFNCVIENNETRKIGLDKKDKGDQTVEIQNHRTVTLNEGNDKLKVKMGNRKIEIDQGNHDLVVSTGNHSIKVDTGKSTVEAMQSIELKVGSNSIKIDQQGITIKGLMITIQGSVKLDAKSPMTTVTGDGMLTLKGGVTMIN